MGQFQVQAPNTCKVSAAKIFQSAWEYRTKCHIHYFDPSVLLAVSKIPEPLINFFIYLFIMVNIESRILKNKVYSSHYLRLVDTELTGYANIRDKQAHWPWIKDNSWFKFMENFIRVCFFSLDITFPDKAWSFYQKGGTLYF